MLTASLINFDVGSAFSISGLSMPGLSSLALSNPIQPSAFGLDFNHDGRSTSVQFEGPGISLDQAVRSSDPAYRDVQLAYEAQARANGFDPSTIAPDSAQDRQTLADLTQTLQRLGEQPNRGDGGIASQMETLRVEAERTVQERIGGSLVTTGSPETAASAGVAAPPTSPAESGPPTSGSTVGDFATGAGRGLYDGGAGLASALYDLVTTDPRTTIHDGVMGAAMLVDGAIAAPSAGVLYDRAATAVANADASDVGYALGRGGFEIGIAAVPGTLGTKLGRVGQLAKIEGAAVAAKNAPALAEIATPYGPALQSLAPEAIAARSAVEGGAPLYRLGTIGRSQAAEAQFWALEHPFDPGYAGRYGIPPENVAKFDFIETATLKPGAPFVTRPAPGIGSNPGGGIEVVTPQNGVTMTYFGTQ